VTRPRVLAVLGWGGLAALLVGIVLTVLVPYLAGLRSIDSGPPKEGIHFQPEGPFGGFVRITLPFVIGPPVIQLGVVMLVTRLLVRFLWKPEHPVS
jgi:hypothetical protein